MGFHSSPPNFTPRLLVLESPVCGEWRGVFRVLDFGELRECSARGGTESNLQLRFQRLRSCIDQELRFYIASISSAIIRVLINNLECDKKKVLMFKGSDFVVLNCTDNFTP